MNDLKQPNSKAPRIIAEIKKLENHRGVMATLRRSCSDAQPYRSYPIYGKLGILHDIPGQIIALLYSHTPSHSDELRNLGESLKKLRKDLDENNNSSFDKRFYRLLECKSLDEIQEILLRLWPLLKRENIPVNYQRLYNDLWKWDENGKFGDSEVVKMQWAKSYFTNAEKPESEQVNEVQP